MVGAKVSGIDLEKLVSGDECDLHSHTNNGLDLTYDGEGVGITKITIIDGIITELEFDT